MTGAHVHEEGDHCDVCGHPFDPHRLAGRLIPEVGAFMPGSEAPVAGWIECPVGGCHCWATWSIKHDAMPPGLMAIIDQELAEVIAAHDDELRHGLDG